MTMHPISRFACGLLLVQLVGLPSAQAQGRLRAFTFSDSALNVESEGLHLRASLGVPFAGTFHSVEMHLSTGFWHTLAFSDNATGTPIERYPVDLPTQFILEGNYPNPFNPRTTIRYALPEAAKVRLAVYDVLGREIHVLVAQNQVAGRYAVPFNASNLPSGVYLYRLEANRHTATGRMLLLK